MFFVLLTIIISQEEFLTPWAKKAQRIFSCDGVVGADEPLLVGPGQRPVALRKICYVSIIFLSFFQLRKRHDYWEDQPCFQDLEAKVGWLLGPCQTPTFPQVSLQET